MLSLELDGGAYIVVPQARPDSDQAAFPKVAKDAKSVAFFTVQYSPLRPSIAGNATIRRPYLDLVSYTVLFCFKLKPGR